MANNANKEFEGKIKKLEGKIKKLEGKIKKLEGGIGGLGDKIKELKDSLEALEKLKSIRKELKRKLSSEDLSDKDEETFAKNLYTINKSIRKLERHKIALAEVVGNINENEQ